MALDFVAGCLGGCAGVLVGHPFDTVKVRIQTQDFRNPQYRGAVDCFTKILKTESVSGLYKGMSSPMAGVAAVNAIVFGVYGNFQRNLSNPEALSSHFLAGAAAGFVQSFVCSPMELVKTRLQVQRNNAYTGPLNCLFQVFKTDGVRGVFRGLGTTICREIPGFGTYFYSYELMTRRSGEDGRPISTLHMLLAGGLSGTISWVLTYPIDVVKSRLQADGCSGVYKYNGFVDCLKKSVASEGYAVLTRGLSSTILRAFPTNAATFTVVTWIIRWANVNHIDDNQGYIIPDMVDLTSHEYVPFVGKPAEEPGFGSKLFGLKERAFYKEGYFNDIFSWRKVILNNIVSNNVLGNFQVLPKSSQVYSLANDSEELPKANNLDETQYILELMPCSNCLNPEVESTEDQGVTGDEIEQNECLKYEKVPNTYEHKNDYYNSSVR